MRNQTPPIITQASGKALRLKDNCFAEVISESGDTHLPFCLPGEEIAFERVQYPKHVNAYFKQVIKPSLERQDPACRHFTACGGCVLQHASEGFYKEFKTALLTQAFLDNGLNPYVIEPIKVVPSAQRRRANLEAIKKGDKLFIGFHRLQSHQIVDMYECPVLTQPLQGALPHLRNALESLLEPFQKAKIFILEINGLVDIGLEIQGVNQLTETQRKTLKVIAEQANWNRLQFRHRKIYDLLWQKEPMTINFGKLMVPIDPWAFLQASNLAQDWMQGIVAQTIEHAGPQTKLLDLFCGRGTFSGILLSYGPVDGFEGDQKAINMLADAGKNFNLAAQTQDLFANPLPASVLNEYSTVVIDPPRAGAEAQAKQLALSTVPLIIYVSCSPHTFARDAKVLENGGYTLETVHPIDQFLWAAHLEVVGIFKKFP